MSELPPLGPLPNEESASEKRFTVYGSAHSGYHRGFHYMNGDEQYTSEHDMPEPPIHGRVAYSKYTDTWFARQPYAWIELAPDDPRIEANQ